MQSSFLARKDLGNFKHTPLFQWYYLAEKLQPCTRKSASKIICELACCVKSKSSLLN